jgi:hypothetical protein
MAARRRILTAALGSCAAATVALAGACGESSFPLPTVDAGAPDARYAAVCAQWADRSCAYEERCQRDLFRRWLDHGQCVQRETLVCELQAEDPDVPFDPAAVGACTFPSSCMIDPGAGGPPSSPHLCLPPGRAPDGAACIWDSGCRSGSCVYSYDIYGIASTCGRCAAFDRCDCADGSICVYLDGGISCILLPGVGEPCGPPIYACKASSCIPVGEGPNGTCTSIPQAGLGEPCSSAPRGPACSDPDLSLYCDLTQHCSAYQAAGYGDPCAGPAGEGRLCAGDGTCDFSRSGVCLPPSPDSEPCDESQGLRCLPPARCLDNACVFPASERCGR